jgi:hypothetical protein
VFDSEIHFPKRNTRSNVIINKYKKQMKWRKNEVRELLVKGHPQRDISSTLQISQPIVSTDISFTKNNYQVEYI